MGLIGSGRKGGGCINVLSTLTMQYICSCQVDSLGGIADFAWWGDGDGFAVAGKNGEVSEYDMNERRVIGRWIDEGAVGTTVIALGGETGRKRLGGDRWVAIGSSSGIVNIYDRREWSVHDNTTGTRGPPIPRTPKPVRTLDQLTTPTSHLVFSADGQMLVMASRWKRDALRIVHLPSCTVYRNWPTDRTPLGRVSSVALSPDGGLLAVGNEQGKIRLWEIRE
jgi:U3 small nucleolar RNA-associated protein 18